MEDLDHIPARCLECGYLVAEIEGDICPECGTQIRPEERLKAVLSMRRAASAVGSMGLVLIPLAFCVFSGYVGANQSPLAMLIKGLALGAMPLAMLASSGWLWTRQYSSLSWTRRQRKRVILIAWLLGVGPTWGVALVTGLAMLLSLFR